MTNRERLLKVLAGDVPDCVPVAPDFSNMIPAKLTGKPFWDLYLYNDPPIWEAYIATAKHFDIDSLMDGYFPLRFPEEQTDDRPWERFIVARDATRIVTQASCADGRQRVWAETVSVYHVADSPAHGVSPENLHLPSIPPDPVRLEGVKPVDTGPTGLQHVMQLMGDQGVVGVFAASTVAFDSPEAIYDYYDHPDLREQWAAERLAGAERRFERIMAMPVRPDFLCVGGSGTLVYQTPEMFRKVAFPAVRRVIELAAAAGMPTHVHSCGPERELVRIFAEETDLTVIDPLEGPPMGDCDLAELKRLHGGRIVLKGNLHTTDVMLRGSVDDVIAASRQAIDAAATGGGFILSTGDQCGRDTPEENLHAMIDIARTYGKY